MQAFHWMVLISGFFAHKVLGDFHGGSRSFGVFQTGQWEASRASEGIEGEEDRMVLG